ncbi:hypothetical protein AB0I91_43540 [Actinosynnema sp. NPDC049800]
MLNTVAPALVAGFAGLLGVVVGGALEPYKLRAARRARVRQDRAERCARLVETTMTSRTRLLALNRAHRRGITGKDLDEWMEKCREARNELRQAVAVMHLSGPQKLINAAKALREAERKLREMRFVQEDDGKFNPDRAPESVMKMADALEAAVYEFAQIARRYTS